MHKKQLTSTSKLLLSLLAGEEALSTLFPTFHEIKKRALFGDWKNQKSFRNSLYQLQKRGWIRFEDRNNKRFVKLTSNGELRALVVKAQFPIIEKWDGKWRIVMFDIPEESREKRDLLRWLLKKRGFRKLQDSVFIHPYPLNREAIVYLKKTGLQNYIRILKVEKMDDDKDLRKMFQL